VVTPGAIAYLLSDRFGVIICLSLAIGATSSILGAYLSFFIDGATGGVIVLLQACLFIMVFLLAPKHGYLAAQRKIGASIPVNKATHD
jgi:manganese/iron transport system permease protein